MLQQMYPQVTHGCKFELNKDFQFAAAHFIPHPDAGVCSGMHGHTYFCNVTIVGDVLDYTGFLVNFHTLKKLIHDRYDHQVINDTTNAPIMPSTEAIAQQIWELVEAHLATLPNRPKIVQVFLRETPTSYVVFRPEHTYMMEGF